MDLQGRTLRSKYEVVALVGEGGMGTVWSARHAVTGRKLAIKGATGNKGVDVSIETSGNGRALHESIRCIRQCGTIVHVPWGNTKPSSQGTGESAAQVGGTDAAPWIASCQL